MKHFFNALLFWLIIVSFLIGITWLLSPSLEENTKAIKEYKTKLITPTDFTTPDGLECVRFTKGTQGFAVSCNWEKFNERYIQSCTGRI